MKIEDYWEDCIIYLVGFKANGKSFHKTLIFAQSDGEIEKHIYGKFKNIENIEYIDVWSDTCLKLKQDTNSL